jgi:hypothetical protein
VSAPDVAGVGLSAPGFGDGRWSARFLALTLLVLAGCATTPPSPPDVLAGQLVVGTEEALAPDGLAEVLALEGYVVRHLSSATEKTHLVEVKRADGTPLSVEETKALLSRLTGRPGVRYVELNALRQPR